MFCVVYALCLAFCGIYPAVSGLVCSGASTPCSVCPEICGCSSFDLSAAGGGAFSHQHLSGGEALSFTTCALLALLMPCLHFASYLSPFVAILFPSHVSTPFLRDAVHAFLLPRLPLLERHRVTFLLFLAPVEAALHHAVFCFPLAN